MRSNQQVTFGTEVQLSLRKELGERSVCRFRRQISSRDKAVSPARWLSHCHKMYLVESPEVAAGYQGLEVFNSINMAPTATIYSLLSWGPKQAERGPKCWGGIEQYNKFWRKHENEHFIKTKLPFQNAVHLDSYILMQWKPKCLWHGAMSQQRQRKETPGFFAAGSHSSAKQREKD